MLPVLLLAVTVFIFGSGAYSAAIEGPMEQLQKSVDEILRILQSEELKRPENKDERKQRILNVVTDMFDFREMAKSSLAQSWNNLTPEEQDTFVGLFTRLVEQRYIGKIDSYSDQKVVYKKQLVKGDNAMIYTDIVDKDLEIPIIYRLEENKGKWLIYDLKIENVSLIVNYRRDFDSIIRKEQFAGLVEKITKQLEKPETSN
jgi:phospholipid transport system substrate-binding protein